MEMIDKRVFLAGIIMSSFTFCEGDLFVRPAIEDLRAYCATSNCGDLLFVKSWGFSPAAYGASPFVHAVASVSNHWQEAMADWDYYATNAEHRLLLQNLIGFAGTNTLLGVWDALMDVHEANTNRCSLQRITEFYDAPSSPLEYYVFEHFDIPAVSNRLVRNRGLCVSNVEMRVYFDGILSGEAKAELQMIR